jgi:putative membrane protein insertion efficiency factor
MTALRARLLQTASTVAALGLKFPIHLYRYTLKAFLGWHCRHLPTCSDYALQAIDRNGPWRGLWLTTARICRCRPGGSRGWDPVPDVRGVSHPLAPWRYARWDSFVGTVSRPADGVTDKTSAV